MDIGTRFPTVGFFPSTSSVRDTTRDVLPPLSAPASDPLIDALVDAFVEALASGLESAIAEAVEDIARQMDAGGQSDGFDDGPVGGGGGVWTERLAPTTGANTDGGSSAARLSQVLDGLNVERNPKYQPSGRPGTASRTTWCNVFTQDALKSLGVPNVPTGTANQMNTWFNTQGPSNGWRKVTAAEAQALANQGKACVATWKNPTGGHGHIGVIRPGQLTQGSPRMAQAGGRNFNDGTVRQGFGAKQPEYFVYDGPVGCGATRPAVAPTSGNVTGAARDDLGGFRSNQYDGIIREMSAKHGVPARLIKSVIEQESQFNPTAVSRVGARGLMQLMPATARELGVRNPLDPRQNIEGGTKDLARMLKMFKGNVRNALAAYNAGPGNVLKYRGVPPFRETQTYVRNITANYYR